MDDNANIKYLVRNSLNLGNYSDWLIVVDNADDPNILLEGISDRSQPGRLYLPRSNRGSIIFSQHEAGRRLSAWRRAMSWSSKICAGWGEAIDGKRNLNKALLNDESAISKASYELVPWTSASGPKFQPTGSGYENGPEEKLAADFPPLGRRQVKGN